jgi:hypothetical protein
MGVEESSIAHVVVQLSVSLFQTVGLIIAQSLVSMLLVEPFIMIQEGQLRLLIQISLSAQLLLNLERYIFGMLYPMLWLTFSLKSVQPQLLLLEQWIFTEFQAIQHSKDSPV